MTALTITVDRARASGQDAANRAMRAAGRTAWNADDANLAAKVMVDLLLAANLLTPAQHAVLSGSSETPC